MAQSLANILVQILVNIGMFLLVVPGIILALMFSQFHFLIIDRRVGVIDSLSLSNQITKGNKLTLLLIYLVAGIGMGLFCTVTFGLGYLVALPFMVLLGCVIYLTMTGQPTVDRMGR